MVALVQRREDVGMALGRRVEAGLEVRAGGEGAAGAGDDTARTSSASAASLDGGAAGRPELDGSTRSWPRDG